MAIQGYEALAIVERGGFTHDWLMEVKPTVHPEHPMIKHSPYDNVPHINHDGRVWSWNGQTWSCTPHTWQVEAGLWENKRILGMSQFQTAKANVPPPVVPGYATAAFGNGVPNSAARILMDGKYRAPEPLENLPSGIRFCEHWVKDPWIGTAARAGLLQWIDDANLLLGQVAGPATPSPETALGPQHCKVCNFRNEYAGREHLSADGSYTCRGCK